jgi:AraC-like DNA-binding protein
MWKLSDLGLVGEVVRNSPTVGAALRALTRYQHCDSDGGLAFLIERGSVVDVGYANCQLDFEAPDVMYDTMLAASINFLRELCGPGWTASEVLLPHARPFDVTPYRNLFKVHPSFNSDICALRFPAHWMMRSVEGADPEKLRIAQEQAEDATPPNLLQQVHRTVRAMLLQQHHAGDDAARMLAIHRRTLNRRLKAEGTTFQRVLDGVRFSVACELLSMSEISLDDVAATLGYAAVSPFMRAFARWAGTAPGTWRRRAVARLSCRGVHRVHLDSQALVHSEFRVGGTDAASRSSQEARSHGSPRRQQNVVDRDGPGVAQNRDRAARAFLDRGEPRHHRQRASDGAQQQQRIHPQQVSPEI